MYRPALVEAYGALKDMLAGIQGTTVTDNTYSISVEYSMCAPYERGGVEAAVTEVLGLSPTLRRTDGDKTLHLRPRIEWNRCRALEWMSQARAL